MGEDAQFLGRNTWPNNHGVVLQPCILLDPTREFFLKVDTQLGKFLQLLMPLFVHCNMLTSS